MKLAFFDTNVLVYVFDKDTPEKQRQAETLLSGAMADGALVISTQVLQEFYVVTTRKLAVPLSSEEAERAIRDLMVFPVVPIDSAMVLAAIRLGRRYDFSFWDSLIVQAGLDGSAEVLYSEDLQDGQQIGPLRIVNPFV